MFFRSKEKKETIKHYKRMIKWAKKQHTRSWKNRNEMYMQIGENWYSQSCPYCKKYKVLPFYSECHKCELNSKVCGKTLCCSGLWGRMDIACTWGEWIPAAKKVLKYIKKYG